MKYLKPFLYALIAVVFILSTAEASELKILHKKTFQVAPGEKLKLDSDVGDVIIKTGDANEVAVVIYGNTKAEDKMEFEITKTNYGVFVKGEKTGSFLSNLFSAFKNINVRYEIQVPKKFNAAVSTSGGDVKIDDLDGKIDLSTAGGDIKISGSEGDAKVSTAGGDIKFKQHAGSVNGSTAGGDIFVETRDGKIDLSTAGGDIKIYCFNSSVDASTTGGDIYAEIDGDNLGVELSSTGGDVRVEIPETMNAELDLHTFGGDVSLNIQGTKNIKTSSSKIKAMMNGGGNKIELSSTGGDIRLSKLAKKN